jgi:4-nitrophenyl phosphatase
MTITRSHDLKTILLDMDGVLWRGNQPLVELKYLFNRLQALGLEVFCITNNSARTKDYYLAKFASFGVDLAREQILTSGEATGVFLIEQFPERGNLFVVGEVGLVETLESCGFQVIPYPRQTKILAVVAGLDRQLTYQKINAAAAAVRGGAKFIGTNPDQVIPVPGGKAPGAGAIIGAIEIASGVKPLIIGKPQAYMFKLALSRANSSPSQAIMIGDRLNTDIAGAQRLGINTALVLSGVTNREEAACWEPLPDIIADDIQVVLDQIFPDET